MLRILVYGGAMFATMLPSVIAYAPASCSFNKKLPLSTSNVYRLSSKPVNFRRSLTSMANSADRYHIQSFRSKNLEVERKAKKISAKQKLKKKEKSNLDPEYLESVRDAPRSSHRRMFPGLASSKLLTAQEEIALARQVQIGIEWTAARYRLRDRLGRNPTCAEWAANVSVDEETLRMIMIRAEKAKVTMVSSNMRFAAHIANRYRYTGLSMSDLLQEASNGLMKATERFNPDRGFKFSTYSIWWIRQCIFRAIAKQSRTIRLPGHAHELDNSIRRATRELTFKNDRFPTDTELAEYLQVSESRITSLKAMSKTSLSMEQTKGGKNPDKSDKSLSHYVSDDEPAPDECTQDSMLKDNVFKLLETLNPREQEVMRLRFGLDDGNEHTLEEVGHAFCVTRERVRQIESRALQKLRQPYRNKNLRPFFPNFEESDITVKVEQSCQQFTLV